MPRGLFNWTFEDVASFLKQHFFEPSYMKSSHYYFKGLVDGEERLPWVPKHGKKSLPPRTLECTISKSGIPKSYWKKWANTGDKKSIQYKGAKEMD